MTFGIIGFGRFGQLWAKCLAPYGRVLVYDKNSIKDREKYSGLDFVDLFEAVKADILFLLVPISEMKSCCELINPLLDKNTLVADACSVKTYPAKIMKENLPPNQPIVATHPLFGPDSASAAGLQGHKIVVCPLIDKADRAGAIDANYKIQTLVGILENLGLAIIESTPEVHDKQMARSQALVHFLGRGLEDLKLQEQEISTPDYVALLRMNNMVQNDTWQLFLDMQKYNPFSASIRADFLNGLKKVEDKIKQYEQENI
ncbi:MAG: prephenate dehydrogenase/arogenate dehydrogenase family protein [Candidatus Magasanikbacteria bacterium CG10_big_fil_rev_8_21_14_0_10_40_10]|uniref:Prephenate dehydrogenase/arogenate dehydrogenase family protein n=1 Tax=Candidatus Magasanikbacteria bacterium CG10_big_fil_rev_8_21_14_0_10_40_10 TaxID=1974648 RepID=A0A2M6W424_9BACT|nr:MAG: prephenate dehydrogenase/arogenate dehydrogenase family protein [Candidatus Magasanikbacteria bacterium CG10_big_fil_rev_8_21_14_0_10_40_10]